MGKTYFRILSYARPFGLLLPQYLVYALFAIVFGLVNFGMLIPLFDIIFGKVDPQVVTTLPPFTLSIDYLKAFFNHFFMGVVQEAGPQGALKFVCIAIITSVFLANLFTFLSGVLLAKIRVNVIRRLRKDIFDKVTGLHLGYFTNERKGDIISRITNDVQEVENSVVNSLKVAFKEPVTIIAYFITLFALSVKLTLFSLILFPISGIIISEVVKRLKMAATQSQVSLGQILSMLDETLGGMRIVKAFIARDRVKQNFGKEVDRYATLNMSMAKKYELASPLSQTFGVFVVAGILLYGGNLVLNNEGSLTGSQFMVYMILFSQILPPAKAISNAVSSIQRGIASADRIFEIIDTKPEIQDAPDAIDLDSFKESIEFKNVSFAYDEREVLQDINLTIKKGTTVALVGPSGGGKSTLADLVPRFYNVSSGQLMVDGNPVEKYKIKSLRKHMGIVTQESILFNDTVHNNIAFGVPDASREQVIEAAKIANAHDFIVKLEEGYDTYVGERGSRLSGGQRQRLSIARAILKNPAIMILDEATSALDSESERLVQDALNNLMKNRTSVVIAHRLSTIQHADTIVVIQEGKIVEQGDHNALMKAAGLYKKLTEMQSF